MERGTVHESQIYSYSRGDDMDIFALFEYLELIAVEEQEQLERLEADNEFDSRTAN